MHKKRSPMFELMRVGSVLLSISRQSVHKWPPSNFQCHICW